jgi:ubiquinone/menaquinone biosynthesis C-methylase UbiE
MTSIVQKALPIPDYLQNLYWWAYVHPRAVRFFDRIWLVNLILFGNYGRLRDAALDGLGAHLHGKTLQLACVYGNISARIRDRLAQDARLDVVDIVPAQLNNLRKKLPADPRVSLVQGNTVSLNCADASYDQVLLFFLLHEQPASVRRATLAQAVRVVKPGGKIVIVDYHRPVKYHLLTPLMRLVFRKLEPYAFDLWDKDVVDWLPEGTRPASETRETFFGGLYQKLVWTR